MLQDPNPIEDPELEKFCDWVFDQRNEDTWLPYLKQEDMRRIWLEGLKQWHLAQLAKCGPPDLYAYHSKSLRQTIAELDSMPDFHPTYLMR